MPSGCHIGWQKRPTLGTAILSLTTVSEAAGIYRVSKKAASPRIG
jgi:hypothetical protein